jgi:phenylacetate-CoA ligase
MMNLIRLLPRFRKARAELATLAERERWPRADVEAYQLERLNAVWGHAVLHVPHYRRLAAERGLPPRFASLAEFRETVPVLGKAEVRARPDDFLSERAGGGEWHLTSGSTGMPMRFFWGGEAHRASMRTKYRFLEAWGVDLFDPAVSLWGRGAALAPGLKGVLAAIKGPVLDWLRNRLTLPAYDLGPADLRRALARIARFRPAMIYGFSRAVHLLALEARAAGWRCPSLRLAIMTSEPAFPPMVRAAEDSLGVPVANEYGSTDLGLTAYEWPDRTLRVREDSVLAETVPLEDGRHALILTTLLNESFPLLRYAIEDTTAAPLALPDVGFAVLANVEGRHSDLILSRTGRPIHPTRIDAVFEFETGRLVRRYGVHQREDGSLDAAVELDDPSDRALADEVRAKLAALVEGYPVRVEVVAHVPQTAAGKHRMIRSDLASADAQAVRPARNGAGGSRPVATLRGADRP